MGVKLPKLKGKAKKKVTDKDIADRRKVLSVWLVRTVPGSPHRGVDRGWLNDCPRLPLSACAASRSSLSTG
jgi:hypothetical protein